MRTAIIARHALTELNQLAYDAPEVAMLNGDLETPLTVKGKVDSIQMGIDLRPFKDQIRLAVSSTLARAVETRDLAAQTLGHDDRLYVEDQRFNERSLGEFTGKSLAEVQQDPWYAPGGLGADFRRSFTVAAPGGENYADVTKRVVPAFHEYFEQIDEEEAMFLVSHGHTIRCLLGDLLGMNQTDIVRLSVPNTTPFILREEDGLFSLSE